MTRLPPDIERALQQWLRGLPVHPRPDGWDAIEPALPSWELLRDTLRRGCDTLAKVEEERAIRRRARTLLRRTRRCL